MNESIDLNNSYEYVWLDEPRISIFNLTHINTNRFDSFKVLATVFKIIKDYYDYNIQTLNSFVFTTNKKRWHIEYNFEINENKKNMKIMKKYNDFVGENVDTPYVDLISNLRKFFEEEGMGDINIVAGEGDKQTMTIELPYKISRKESWWTEFIEICNNFGYNEIYPSGTTILIYRSLGIFKEPNGYTQFLD